MAYIKIQTEQWKDWPDQVNKLCLVVQILIALIVIALLAKFPSWVIYVTSGMIMLITILTERSLKKWRKENQKPE